MARLGEEELWASPEALRSAIFYGVLSVLSTDLSARGLTCLSWTGAALASVGCDAGVMGSMATGERKVRISATATERCCSEKALESHEPQG